MTRWDRKEITFWAWGSWKRGEKDKQKENKVLYVKVTVQHHCVATGNCKNQSKEENKGNKINLRLLSRCVTSHRAFGALPAVALTDTRGALQHVCSAHLHNQSGVVASWEAGPQKLLSKIAKDTAPCPTASPHRLQAPQAGSFYQGKGFREVM